MTKITLDLPKGRFSKLNKLRGDKSWADFICQQIFDQDKPDSTKPTIFLNFELACGYARIGLPVKRSGWPRMWRMSRYRGGLKVFKGHLCGDQSLISDVDRSSNDWFVIN